MSALQALALLALFGATACCGNAKWPVPVPYATDGAATPRPWRFECALPLPPAAAKPSPSAPGPSSGECKQLQDLVNYLSMRATATTAVDGKAFAVDDELWSLLQTLTNANALKTPRFPRDVEGLSKEVRGLDTFATLDARDATPPQGRQPVAFSYRGFWWTFWLKKAAPPPNPDAGGEFNGSDAFDDLIVFPEFQGRRE